MGDSRAAFRGGRWAVMTALLLGFAAALVSNVHATSSPTERASRHGGRDGRARGFDFRGIERCFMSKLNNQRDRKGLRQLKWDEQIGYVARRHARAMAKQGRVEHDYRVGRRVTRWLALAQNTGSGKSCMEIVRAFWWSSGHRANILGRWRYVGVGVGRARHGRVYVQQIFEYRSDPGNVYRFP
jgi:uncharacterized protein YkwD